MLDWRLNKLCNDKLHDKNLMFLSLLSIYIKPFYFKDESWETQFISLVRLRALKIIFYTTIIIQKDFFHKLATNKWELEICVYI